MSKELEYCHTTADGRTMKLSEMTDTHLYNTIKRIEQLAIKGVLVRQGGGTDPDDYWYDEDELTGNEALEYLHYMEYVNEKERRDNLSRRKSVCSEKEVKRLTFRLIRFNKGNKELVNDRGIFFEPVENNAGGYVSYYAHIKALKESSKEKDQVICSLEEINEEQKLAIERLTEKLKHYREFTKTLLDNIDRVSDVSDL